MCVANELRCEYSLNVTMGMQNTKIEHTLEISKDYFRVLNERIEFRFYYLWSH